VDKILDEKKGRGRGQKRYLVRWVGQGPEHDLWLPEKELEDCEALDIWIAAKPPENNKHSRTRGG